MLVILFYYLNFKLKCSTWRIKSSYLKPPKRLRLDYPLNYYGATNENRNTWNAQVYRMFGVYNKSWWRFIDGKSAFITRFSNRVRVINKRFCLSPSIYFLLQHKIITTASTNEWMEMVFGVKIGLSICRVISPTSNSFANDEEWSLWKFYICQFTWELLRKHSRDKLRAIDVEIHELLFNWAAPIRCSIGFLYIFYLMEMRCDILDKDPYISDSLNFIR